MARRFQCFKATRLSPGPPRGLARPSVRPGRRCCCTVQLGRATENGVTASRKPTPWPLGNPAVRAESRGGSSYPWRRAWIGLPRRWRWRPCLPAACRPAGRRDSDTLSLQISPRRQWPRRVARQAASAAGSGSGRGASQHTDHHGGRRLQAAGQGGQEGGGAVRPRHDAAARPGRGGLGAHRGLPQVPRRDPEPGGAARRCLDPVLPQVRHHLDAGDGVAAGQRVRHGGGPGGAAVPALAVPRVHGAGQARRRARRQHRGHRGRPARGPAPHHQEPPAAGAAAQGPVRGQAQDHLRDAGPARRLRLLLPPLPHDQLVRRRHGGLPGGPAGRRGALRALLAARARVLGAARPGQLHVPHLRGDEEGPGRRAAAHRRLPRRRRAGRQGSRRPGPPQLRVHEEQPVRQPAGLHQAQDPGGLVHPAGRGGRLEEAAGRGAGGAPGPLVHGVPAGPGLPALQAVKLHG